MGDGLPPGELLAREAPEALQTIKAIAPASWSYDNYDTTLLLKTPHVHVHTVTVGHEETILAELETASLRAGLYNTRDALQGAGGDLSPTFLPGYGPCVLKY